MFDEIIKSRKIPPALDQSFQKSGWQKRRGEILEIMQREEYGYIPKKPESMSFTAEETKISFCAGKAKRRIITLTSKLENGNEFSFPVTEMIPTGKTNIPFIVYISFSKEEFCKYLPVEEIIDRGFAILSFCYSDITSDNGDFNSGLAGKLFNGNERQDSDPGKIAMWSWAAQRVMDYAYNIDALDKSNAIAAGHSRLGKTALLTGAYDRRFKMAYSNDSGCSGAAVSRGKTGETVALICKTFDYWFCKNYLKYAENEDKLPFDQHWLVSALAPRLVYVASAKNDDWACPENEFLSCVLANEVYSTLGCSGIDFKERFPKTDEVYHSGNIGYHIRPGDHYLSREDWNKALDFFILKMQS